jgi:surface antigen
MRSAFKGLIVAAVLGGSGVAVAAGYGFLAESPMGKFSEDDLKLMNGAIADALAARSIGTPVRWANDGTRSSGEVTPRRAFESQGRPCRDLRIVNRHRTLEATGVYTLCRDNGDWKLAQ